MISVIRKNIQILSKLIHQNRYQTLQNQIISCLLLRNDKNI